MSKFKPTTARSNAKKPASTLECDYCHNNGHSRDKCFCLHGYPDWHRLYGKPKPKPRKLTSSTTSPGAAQVSVITSDITSDTTKDALQFSDAQCQ